jgi:hypothetical protein
VTLSARKYATGKPKMRQAATAMSDVTKLVSMLCQYVESWKSST